MSEHQAEQSGAPLRDALLLEDLAIERAAIALCWEGRPVPLGGKGYVTNPEEWWHRQGMIDQRIFRRRARVVVEAWELAHG